jgi:multicomponent Na+:H+ antiporter subunit G
MITEILLTVAGIWAVLGALGLFRFPDFYTRSHAATMISVGGVMFALFVLMFGERFLGIYFFKILVVLIMLLITGPTAAHAIANKAYMVGIAPKKLGKNEMESKPGGGRK